MHCAAIRGVTKMITVAICLSVRLSQADISCSLKGLKGSISFLAQRQPDLLIMHIVLRGNAADVQNKASVLPRLSALAAERRAAAPLLPLNAGSCSTAPAAVLRYLLLAGRSAANRAPPFLRLIDRTDRHRDRRTDTRPLRCGATTAQAACVYV